MDSFEEAEMPVQPSSEVSNVAAQSEQPVEITSFKPKAKTLVVVIIVIVCLLVLGGGIFLLGKSTKDRFSRRGWPVSNDLDGRAVNKDECEEVRRLAVLAADPVRKLVFSSKSEVASQFSGVRFPVFPGLKLCYSLVEESQDEQDLGTTTISVAYYVVSSVAEASKWYTENIAKSELPLKALSVDNPTKQNSLNYPVLQQLYATGDHDSYYWEAGCCAPGQLNDSFARIDISKDETFPVVAFMYVIDVFRYKR